MAFISIISEPGRIVTRVDEESRSVLIIHGYGGSAAEMLPLAHGLAVHGIGSVTIDLPGHGDSRDMFTYEGCREAIDRELGCGETPIAIIGHSLGARLALLYDSPVVCLSAPLALDFERGRSQLLRILRVRRVREASAFAGLRAVLLALPEVTFGTPAVIYYAADDLATVKDFAGRGYEAGVATIRVEGANHVDIVSAPEVSVGVATWLKELR